MSHIGVIILAAGKGTRMKSTLPKVCFELVGKSLIQRVVDASINLKAEKIAVVVGYKAEIVKHSITPHPTITFVQQTEQKGTADAVKRAKDCFASFKGTIFVLCGDVPLLTVKTLTEMHKKHTATKAACTVLTMELENPDKYGRIVRNSESQLTQIVEYLDADQKIRDIKEVNTGVYCFNAKELFATIAQVTNNNAKKEYYLTDVIKILSNNHKKVESVLLDDHIEAEGVNSLLQLAELEQSHYEVIRNHWMKSGVCIQNPQTVLISEDSIIERGVYISAGSHIMGKSHIKHDVFIGPNCVVIDSTLDTDSFLSGYNVVKDAHGEQVKLQWYESKGV